ncbi:MAG: thiolase family protein [Anaerovoracaceae bacterium]
MREPVIVAYGRSAVCKSRKGGFSGMHPLEYASQVLDGVLNKIPQLDRGDIEDIIVGCAVQHGRASMNMGKLLAARLGLPQQVSGQSINRFCSSGLQAIATASNAILAGQGDVYIAGGIEDMTGTFEPYPEEYWDPWLKENEPGAYMPMGITAENVVKRYNVTREEMDMFAVDSHRKAKKARDEGKLAPSIIPVMGRNRDGEEKLISVDEGIRDDVSFKNLQDLKPCFLPPDEGTVTAGTSSQTSDAAAFVVLMDREKAESLGIKPIGRLVSFAVAGCDSTEMGVGPVYAVPKVMERAAMSLADMDVIEINEAFASQSIYCIRKLGFKPEKVNPYGGALALGHPMGATGAFLTEKVFDYLKDNNKRYGLVTMCIGGGMGAAGIFERFQD